MQSHTSNCALYLYVKFVPDAYVNFTAVVMLEESAVINETYDFLTEVTLGSLSTVQFLPEIVTTDVMSSVVRLQHISLPMSVAVISLCSF